MFEFRYYPRQFKQCFYHPYSKIKRPERVFEFRPFALCNILYKSISKVLDNCMKSLLPYVVSESQSAFQFDKAISDNILVVFETLHHIKTKKRARRGIWQWNWI